MSVPTCACHGGRDTDTRAARLTVWAQGPSSPGSHGQGYLRAAAAGLAGQFGVGHGHRRPTAARRPRGRSCPRLPAQLFQNPPNCSSTWAPAHAALRDLLCANHPCCLALCGSWEKTVPGTLNTLATRLTGHGVLREGRAGSRATGTDPVWPRLTWTPGGLAHVLGLAPREGRGATATRTRPHPARASALPQGSAAQRWAPSGSGQPPREGN